MSMCRGVIAGHNPDGLTRRFLDKYKGHYVPVKKAMTRRHDGERYKPETGRRIDGNFYFV